MVTAEQVAQDMRRVVAELGTPAGHSGPLPVKQLLWHAARRLGMDESRVRAFWHGRGKISAEEWINATARLEEHRLQTEERAKRCAQLASRYDAVRARRAALVERAADAGGIGLADAPGEEEG